MLYRVTARFQDAQAQAVAARYAGFSRTNQEGGWTLLWRDASLTPDPMTTLPLTHHFFVGRMPGAAVDPTQITSLRMSAAAVGDAALLSSAANGGIIAS